MHVHICCILLLCFLVPFCFICSTLFLLKRHTLAQWRNPLLTHCIHLFIHTLLSQWYILSLNDFLTHAVTRSISDIPAHSNKRHLNPFSDPFTKLLSDTSDDAFTSEHFYSNCFITLSLIVTLTKCLIDTFVDASTDGHSCLIYFVSLPLIVTLTH